MNFRGLVSPLPTEDGTDVPGASGRASSSTTLWLSALSSRLVVATY